MANALNKDWGGGFTTLLTPDLDKSWNEIDRTMRHRTKAVAATWRYFFALKDPVPKVGARYWNLLIANGIVDG